MSVSSARDAAIYIYECLSWTVSTAKTVNCKETHTRQIEPIPAATMVLFGEKLQLAKQQLPQAWGKSYIDYHQLKATIVNIQQLQQRIRLVQILPPARSWSRQQPPRFLSWSRR